MRGQFIIDEDGTLTVEVLDREGQDCRNILKLTERLGKQVGEETTGPYCDSVQEME